MCSPVLQSYPHEREQRGMPLLESYCLLMVPVFMNKDLFIRWPIHWFIHWSICPSVGPSMGWSVLSSIYSPAPQLHFPSGYKIQPTQSQGLLNVLKCWFSFRSVLNADNPEIYGQLNSFLSYIFRDQTRSQIYTVIIDLRGSSWKSAKPLLRTLQVCQWPIYILL